MFRPIKPTVRKLKSGAARIKRDSYSSGTTGWWTIRREVSERSGGRCEALVGGWRCTGKAKDCHHIVPVSRGGTTKKSNLIDLCDDCHRARHKHLR